MKKYLEYLAESKKPHSGYIKENNIIIENDFLKHINLEEFKKLVKNGLDINSVNKQLWSLLMLSCSHILLDFTKFILSQPNVDINYSNQEFNALIVAAYFLEKYKNDYSKETLKLLLSQPNIDIKNNTEDKNFIDYLKKYDKSFLIDYDMQKKILDNNRDDIILFLNDHELIHPKIKDDYPELFKAKDWGLI
jgi:hypothetical protein